MEVDITVAPADLSSTCRRQVADYSGPASYATGGDAIDANLVRMAKIFAILNLTISNGTTVHHGWFNADTNKIMWFVAAGTQVTNATDLSTFTGRMEFVGQ